MAANISTFPFSLCLPVLCQSPQLPMAAANCCTLQPSPWRPGPCKLRIVTSSRNKGRIFGDLTGTQLAKAEGKTEWNGGSFPTHPHSKNEWCYFTGSPRLPNGATFRCFLRCFEKSPSHGRAAQCNSKNARTWLDSTFRVGKRCTRNCCDPKIREVSVAALLKKISRKHFHLKKMERSYTPENTSDPETEAQDLFCQPLCRANWFFNHAACRKIGSETWLSSRSKISNKGTSKPRNLRRWRI